MSLLRKIVKSLVLAPVNVVRGVIDAVDEVILPPEDRPKK